jgi:hypothetical protein
VGAQAQNAPALTGQVTSAEEGAMEGVVVSARKDGSTITVSVVTDDKGNYRIPADRLEPGHYMIAIRAGGYDLGGPRTADVASGGSVADIKLVKTKNPANQLTNAEWLISAPGPDSVKANATGCVDCHTLQRLFISTHDATEFKQVAWAPIRRARRRCTRNRCCRDRAPCGRRSPTRRSKLMRIGSPA